MLSQKIRNNASISYFFLGWLFLLAKYNPNFSDPFIRQHAKVATKGHVLFFAFYFFYSHFLSDLFSYSLPVLQITVDRCIDMAFFAALTFFIIRWAYDGQKGDVGEVVSGNSDPFSLQGRTFRFSGATEAQRIVLLFSHIPFIGLVVSSRYPNIVTITGARASSIFWFAYIASFVNGGFSSLSMILLFVGILIIVFLAARFFLSDHYVIPELFEKIPPMDELYRIIRSVPFYFVDVGRMIFGKNDSVSFRTHLERIRETDRSFRSSLREYFTDDRLPFRPFWIFVPFFNLVFLPKLFMSRTTKYVLAIGQGLVVTLFAFLFGFLFSFTSPALLFLLFPVFYGIASLESDAFFKIPLVYESYAILNAFTFGLLKNTQRIRSVQKQDTAVSFKME